MFKNIFSVTKEQKENRKYLVFRILGLKFKKRIKQGFIYLVNGEKRRRLKKVKGLSVTFLGSDSVIEIVGNKVPEFSNCKIQCMSNSYIKIESTEFVLSNIMIKCGRGSEVKIGKNFSVNSMVVMNYEPNIKISIGDDCMFSTSVYLRSHDGHTIYNEETREVLNYPEDIKIGNHVWFGNGVRVLKGADIPDNTVVGIGSIVTKSSTSHGISSGSILVGSPAKVLKTGCNWSRKSIEKFLEEEK